MGTKASLKLDMQPYLEQIARLGEGVDAATDEMMEAGAQVALAGMKRRVPVDTGHLQESLTTSEAQTDGNYHFIEIGLLGVDEKTAIYGNVQEFGSSSVKAHPYVRSTMKGDRSKIRKAQRAALSAFLAAKSFAP